MLYGMAIVVKIAIAKILIAIENYALLYEIIFLRSSLFQSNKKKKRFLLIQMVCFGFHGDLTAVISAEKIADDFYIFY